MVSVDVSGLPALARARGLARSLTSSLCATLTAYLVLHLLRVAPSLPSPPSPSLPSPYQVLPAPTSSLLPFEPTLRGSRRLRLQLLRQVQLPAHSWSLQSPASTPSAVGFSEGSGAAEPRATYGIYAPGAEIKERRGVSNDSMAPFSQEKAEMAVSGNDGER